VVRLRLALLLLVAPACGRSSPQARPPSLGGGAVDPPLDAGELADDLRATILESYRAVSGGYEEAYLDGLVHDGRLVLIDVGPDDAIVGYDPMACRLRRQFPQRHLDIVSKSLEVHLARDLSTAWSYDEISYRVVQDGKRIVIPLRATGLYERRDGRWLLVQEHVSYGIPDDEALRDGAPGRGIRPKSLGDHTPPGRRAMEVRGILLKLIRDDDHGRLENVSTEPDVLVLGSDPEREKRGGAVAGAATIREILGNDLTAGARELRIQVGRTGTVAWAAGNVLVEGTRDDRRISLTLRATWVLEWREKAWRVVQMHLSLPIAEERLLERILGPAL